MSDKDVPDHDQRFKVLVQEFFREFLFCFFPDWAERFDYNGSAWNSSS